MRASKPARGGGNEDAKHEQQAVRCAGHTLKFYCPQVTCHAFCYALTLPLGRGSQLGLGPRDNGQEQNGLPDPGSGPKDR